MKDNQIKKLFEIAITKHKQGNLSDAENYYNKILKINSDHVQSIFLLGTVLAQRKKFDSSIKLLKKTISLSPNHKDAYNNLGNVFKELKEYEISLSYYLKSLRIDPNYIEAHKNIGNINYFLGKYKEAILSYNKVIKINPNYAEAQNNLGVNLKHVGKYKDAISSLKKAIEINPNYIDAYINLGISYKLVGMHQEAIICYQNVLKINPKNENAYTNIGNIFNEEGKTKDAITSFDKAIEINPNYLVAHWLSLNTFPVIYSNKSELEYFRKRFLKKIKNINLLLKNNYNFSKEEILNALQSSTNFYLHYQGKNDLKLQTKYAAIIEHLTKKIYPKYFKKRIAKLNKKIRIGFISSYFKKHSIAKTHKNWIIKLDKNKFETFVYYIGNDFDKTTHLIKENSNHFFTNTNIDILINKISNDDLKFLIYTDIGMNPKIQILASLRLAQTQCQGMGHPVTSGFKNIDYVISSNLMERKNSQSLYMEKLVKLPNTGQYYENPSVDNIKNNISKTHDNLTVFLNLQSLYKLLPEDDHIYLDIINKYKECEFWFIQEKNENITNIFKNRINKIFKKSNLDFKKFFIFYPRMSQAEFFNIINKSDIILDSLNWSGNNSSHEAINLNKPIVSYPSNFMRGRHTYAILKLLKLEDLIAYSKSQYVNIAIKLAKNQSFRNSIVNKIKKNKIKLFNDKKPIISLEKFFLNNN